MTGPFDFEGATPSTDTSLLIYQTIRRAMIDHVDAPTNGGRLRDVLGNPERIYIRSAPPRPTFPYVTLLLDRDTTAGYNSYRETMRCEVQIIGKPEGQLSVIEWAGDLIDRTLLSTLQHDSGFMSCRMRQRSTLPQFTDPAEAGTVAVRSVFDMLLWSRSLTVRAAP